MKATALILAFFFVAGASRSDEPGSSDVLQLNHVRATDALAIFSDTFPEIEGIVKRIDLEKNCFVLNPGHPKADKLRELVKAIDVRPQEIRLDAVGSLIAADGRKKVLTRPTHYTIAGKTVEIWLGEYDGAKLKLMVRPSIVEE